MKVESIARVCHEGNRAFCQAYGDDSQQAWPDAPEWQKESCIAGVAKIVANPKLTPEEIQAEWAKDKRAAGWVYGPAKDPNATPPTHPCLVPYDQLPVEQRAKDYVFGAIVRALAFP